MRLYDIASAYRSLQDQLDSAETPEEMVRTLMDTMESIQGDFEDKAENMAALISENKATINACNDEIKRLQAKISRLENQNDNIMSYMMMEMRFAGIRKIKAGTWQISIAKNGGKAPIKWSENINTDDLPSYYTKVTKEIDTTAVRNALEAGVELDFARLGERGESLRIK